jgi:hypothetical protein
MKRIILAALLFVSVFGQAQKIAKPDAYAKTITPEDLRRHLFIVAGREMQGREATSEGERKAAAYIEGEFKRIGLQPGNNGAYRQFFPVYRDSLLNATFEVNGRKFMLDQDFNTSVSNNPSMMAFSEVVYIPTNISSDSLKTINMAGKMVIIMGTNQSRQTIALQKGVAALLTISESYPRRTPASRNGNMTMQFFRPELPMQQFTISKDVAAAILGADFTTKYSQNAPVTVKANVLTEVQKRTTILQSSNVIGILPGTDKKDEYLFITAHYDHEGHRGDSVIYYGADDDGSGTVSVIELAEAFMKAAKEGKGPRRSVVFMTVSGEEKGLWGSAYYGANPIYPLEKTTADLNIDMIGRSDTSRKKDTLNYVYVVGDDKVSSDLKPISEEINKKYTKLDLDYKFNDPNDRNRIYFRSDHYNFARYGVPIIFYYDGMLGGDYHKPTDTPDKINYSLLAKRAQLVFYTAWEMANRNEMLKRDLGLPSARR